MISAAARRLNRGVITPPQFRRIAHAVESETPKFILVELDPSVDAAARLLLAPHDLRAGDAVQLAACLHMERQLGRRVEFVCYDERLATAARAEGLRVLGAA